jgi:hypothetical protein
MGAQIVVGLLSGIVGALLATFVAPRIQHYYGGKTLAHLDPPAWRARELLCLARILQQAKSVRSVCPKSSITGAPSVKCKSGRLATFSKEDAP